MVIKLDLTNKKKLTFLKRVKTRSNLSVVKLSAAKIEIQPQQLLSVAALHKALICFTEYSIKPTSNEALLCYATLKYQQALSCSQLRNRGL